MVPVQFLAPLVGPLLLLLLLLLRQVEINQYSFTVTIFVLGVSDYEVTH